MHEITSKVINKLVNDIHKQNVTIGWWGDNPNIAEKLCLIHSEISEAMEGHRRNKQDDHLPNRLSVEVELADAIIRIFDLAGYLKLDIGNAINEKIDYNLHRSDHMISNRAKSDGKKY
jgi:NTP pyrophosphatase (non-canonical NTP hydrolase)